MASEQVDDFSPPAEGEIVAVQVDGEMVAVTVVAGELHAFDAKCPHAGCSLADGVLDEGTVTCACHFAQFDISTGAVLGGPARSGVRLWSADLRDGTLTLDGPRAPASRPDAASSQPTAPADAGLDQDITVVIEREHDALRQHFRSLDRGAGEQELEQAWRSLVQLLEVHASAEEVLLYPDVVRAVDDGAEQTEDAVRDHNGIRDSVRAVDRYAAGSDSWWAAVELARRVNDAHLHEEEREVLPSLRRSMDRHRREELGQQWAAFHAEHQQAQGLSGDATDPQAVIEQRPGGQDPRRT